MSQRHDGTTKIGAATLPAAASHVLLLVFLFVVLVPASSSAQMNVVATTSSMGMLARTVGGDAVAVTVLAPPDRDAHSLLARPSMMIALRRANLLVAVGADLEAGWLPAAIRGAGNGGIQPGQPGYFEGAAQLTLLETGAAADRARGDVHPAGNPHFYMDPLRMATLATALGQRLAQIDPANQAGYTQRAAKFGAAVEARVPGWKAAAKDAPGVVLYHKDVNYLAAFLEVRVLGYIEPVPGIPPTASHLRDLVQRLTGQRGVILFSSFQPSDGPEFLARTLSWPRVQLSLEAPLDADGAAYLAHIDTWVNAIARAYR
jgi:zinc/manganese transport system substrate-binding protein